MKRQREQSPVADDSEPWAPYDDGTQHRRDKRRREIIERVERLRKESNDRRDNIFNDILNSMHAAHMSLLSTPLPTHGPFLLRLHELSIQREIAVSQARVHSVHRQNLARKLHTMEMERIEDEYELAKRGVKDKLLEACDERARKLREEKDSVELNLDTLFDSQSRPHVTRQRPSRANRYADLANGTDPSQLSGAAMVAKNSNALSGQIPLPTNGFNAPFMEGSLSTTQSQGTDNNFPYSLLPASPLLANFPVANKDGAATANAMLNPNALLSTLASIPTARVTRKKNAAGTSLPAYIANPTSQGLPSQNQQFNIQPGKYEFGGRSLFALKALATEEINEDLTRLMARKSSNRRQGRAPRI